MENLNLYLYNIILVKIKKKNASTIITGDLIDDMSIFVVFEIFLTESAKFVFKDAIFYIINDQI